MSTPQLCLVWGNTLEPVVSGNKPHKFIRIAKYPGFNPTEFHEYALIVRCKDCKYFNTMKEECFAHWEEGVTEGIAFSATTDGFCAWGELKEGIDT